MNSFYAFCITMHSRVINKMSDGLKLATVAVQPASLHLQKEFASHELFQCG